MTKDQYKRREKNKSDVPEKCEVEHKGDNDERLKEIIDEVNRKALSDELRPYEVALLREMLPQLRDMLEAHRRQQWIAKRIGMFLLGVPAAVAMWQSVTKIVEWIRGQ